VDDPDEELHFISSSLFILFTRSKIMAAEKELKAQWPVETELPEYTLKEVAAHNTKSDTWIVIHGQGNCFYCSEPELS
jgi:hypothetical protein